MSKNDKTPPWPNPFALFPNLGEMGAASADMTAAWSRAWGAMLTERAAPALSLFLNPAAWSGKGEPGVAEALESMLGTPQWSDMASLDSETLKSFAPAAELVQVSQAYALETTRVCAEICRRFQERLAASGVKLDGSGEALDLWNATVDETLMSFNRSEAFADIQRRFIRAYMACRREQRWLVGRMSEQFDVPTRAEIDELTRRVHDLERENRRIRRALAERESRPE